MGLAVALLVDPDVVALEDVALGVGDEGEGEDVLRPKIVMLWLALL